MNAAWLPGQAISVIGAAHQRQGKPCQDASLCCQLKAGHETLQLLAVADGHGASRYWLSHVGSALACAEAEQAVRQALTQTPLRDQAAWRQLLHSELASRIHSAWLVAVERDWQGRPEAAEQPFSALSYGCTLGLVVLAPQWWGCSGIGDWDLAAVAADGSVQLLSEEIDGTGSEATGSLCQPLQEQPWGERALLQPIDEQAPQALVLSTDGVRKSCATDADYLNLCSALIDLSSSELQTGLQQITSEGSGDDVSVAMALRPCHRPSATPTRRQPAIRWALAGLTTLALTAVAGLAGWRWLQQPAPLDQLIADLCKAPERIRPTLNQRRSQFAALLKQPNLRQQLQAQANTDPLGALIASNASQSCPTLQLELQRQWREARAAGVKAPAKGKMPATAPSPP
ncbi:MAG: hypothetical protein RLZZ631_1934 [Cyanobacteriota bacterium]